MILARSVRAFIVTRDDRLMRRLHHWQAPRWVRAWMIAATRLGDGWLWYAIGLALLVFGGPSRFVAVGCEPTRRIVSFVLSDLSTISRLSKLEPASSSADSLVGVSPLAG